MESEFLKYLATLGVGGSLAGFIFYFYRRDSDKYVTAWQGQAGILMGIVRDNTSAMTSLQAAIGELQSELRRRDPVNCPLVDRRAQIHLRKGVSGEG